MKKLPILFALAALPAFAAEPLYKEDFQKTEPGKVPADLLVMAGDFAVKEAGAEKYLELPGAPLDAFGALFGPSVKDSVAVSAKFYGTKQGRKFPAFGISVNGASGYRLQVSAAKKALEVFKGDQPVASVPFEWTSDSWTMLKIQIRKASAGWMIEGKAWLATGAEPDKWTVSYEEKEEPNAGRPGIWGNPFSGTPIRFDDLNISPAH